MSSKNTTPKKTPIATGIIKRWVPVMCPLFLKKTTPIREREAMTKPAMSDSNIIQFIANNLQ